jgi:hypothetical protein
MTIAPFTHHLRSIVGKPGGTLLNRCKSRTKPKTLTSKHPTKAVNPVFSSLLTQWPKAADEKTVVDHQKL